MMARTMMTALLLLAAVARPASAINPGDRAPDFTLKDIQGKIHSLSDYKGKMIVLEWTNPRCPFVNRHYAGGAMQALQERWREKGIVWLTINSTARSSREYMTADELAAKYGEWKPASSANLLDPEGNVGRLYGAKTTPHMFVIDGDFTVAYQGAVDNDPRGREGNRVNYVDEALTALLEGHRPEITSTQSYGCSVKYGD